MPDVKEIIKQIQLITYGAYGASGQVAALLGEPDSDPKAVAKALENTAARLERGAVELRAICERSMPPVSTIGKRPTLPSLDIAGQVCSAPLADRHHHQAAGSTRGPAGKTARAGPRPVGDRGAL